MANKKVPENLTSCLDCPYCKAIFVGSGTNWDELQSDYVCKKSRNNLIVSYRQFEKMPPIPDWCPIMWWRNNHK